MHILLALDYLHMVAGIVHTGSTSLPDCWRSAPTKLVSRYTRKEYHDGNWRSFYSISLRRRGEVQSQPSQNCWRSGDLHIPETQKNQATWSSNAMRFWPGSLWIELLLWGYSAIYIPGTWGNIAIALEWEGGYLECWSIGRYLSLVNLIPSTNPKWQQTWDIFQQGHLFYGRDSNKSPSDAYHLAEMVAIMGLPPKEMVQNSEYATTFFDAQGMYLSWLSGHITDNGTGNWRGAVEIPSKSLEKLEGNLQGQSQQLFLRFLRKTLKWNPIERQSARELLEDPWLRSS